MFGKKSSEYIQFEKWILILIAVVFALRFGLSMANAPFTLTRWVSLNIVLLVALVYCSIAVHTSGFGSYKQLFGLLLLQWGLAHLLIAGAIVLGILTGTDNAFTAPEVSGGGDGKFWFHAIAHAIGGFIFSVVAWLIGSVILFVTRRVVRR